MSEQSGSGAALLAGQPAAAGAAAGGAGAGAPWFGDAHKDLVGAKGWKSPDDALQSYRGLEQLLGADKAGRGAILPKDENDVETANALYTRLGRPEKADGYKLSEGLKDDPMAKAFRDEAHKAGLSARQFEAATGWFEQAMTKERDRQDAEFKAKVDGDTDKLKSEWGAAWDGKIELARRATRQFGVDEGTLGALEEKMGTAWLYKFFANVGEKLGEDPGVRGGTGAGGFGMTPEQATAGIGALWGEHRAALLDKNHPQHAEKTAELERLYKFKVGQKP